MPATHSPKDRFRILRERAGLSPGDAARAMGLSSPSLWDIESYDDEISSCYSPAQVQKFCRVLGAHPSALFAVETVESPVSAAELARLIHEQCESRGVTLEQFEDFVGGG
ncbi:MAG TPA: helix-turn-helix transcriptional regulator [Verrucomicrobiales bacterium]|nr:helix-turn-helix transcriptional regulator [Verrucomicrobiales bacterium]